MPANGDGQQSLAGASTGVGGGAAAAAADQAGNEPLNSGTVNSGTAAGDVTVVSHTSSTDNEDAADHTAPATGDADHNSQITEGASSLGPINGGFSGQDNSPTNTPIQDVSEQSATDGASDQQDVTVTENFEDYRGE